MKIIPVNPNQPRPIKAKARLTSKKQISHYVYELSFEMVEPQTLDFKPGQYIALIIEPTIRRQYSISTSPSFSKKHFQIILDIKPDGLGVNYLMNLKDGDQIEFIGQIGMFVLPPELKRDLYFIATGTGIGPLKSMIDELINRGIAQDHDIHVIFGTRYVDDIFYEKEFLDYLNRFYIKSYHIYLSRAPEATQYNHGYVTEYFLFNEIDFQKAQAFICGSGQMIIDTERILIEESGMDEDDIYYEKFY